MSIISSIFIFLLFLSMQACNARNFKVADEVSSGQLHFSDKGLKTATEEVMKLNIDSIQREAKDGITEKSHDGEAIDLQKLLLTKSKALHHQDMKHKNKGFHHQDMKHKNKGLIPGVARIKSLILVSWHVPPHKNNGNGNPGVYSDYSRPKTRPPSHN